MSPLSRNIALAVAALAIPAAIAAAAGPDRMRRLPEQVRDLWSDDSVEGQLKRLTARLDDLTDDLHIRASGREDLAQAGRFAAIAGAVLLIPAALAAWIGPARIRDTLRDYRDDWRASPDDDFSPSGRFDDLSDDLENLERNIETQRDDAFGAVTSAALGRRG